MRSLGQTQMAITGWALRTALGHHPGEVVSRLLAGERAVQENPIFPAASYPCRLGAAITGAPAPAPVHDARVLRRLALYAVETAREALTHSGAPSGPRLGVFCGMGGLRAHWNDIMPALENQHDDLANSWALGFRSLHPFWMLQHLSNNAHALFAEAVQAQGEGVTFAGANASAQALCGAARALADGAVDAAVVMAYDSLLEPETVIEMAGRGALAQGNAESLRAPYDLHANGAVPGEAAAAVVLERPDDAGARALAFIDAADGAGVLPATLARLGVRAHAVDGAAQAQRAFDDEERTLVARVVGDDVCLTAIQGALGQLGAATSLVQAIVLGSALRRELLPPIAGLVQPAPGPLVPLQRATPLSGISGPTVMGLCVGAPGLVAAIVVTRP